LYKLLGQRGTGMKEEIYWFIEISIWDHDQITDKVKHSFKTKEDAEAFFEKAFTIFDEDAMDWQKKTDAKSNNYDFIFEHFDISGFMKGKPKMFECRRIK